MVEYKVFHKNNIGNSVILEFEETQSSMSVKGRACREGYFPWGDYTSLRIRKLKAVRECVACGKDLILENDKCVNCGKSYPSRRRRNF